MAAKSSTALKELDEQLICSVCLDQYTNPKTLQCHHSYCLKCIENLPQEHKVNTSQTIHYLLHDTELYRKHCNVIPVFLTIINNNYYKILILITLE